MALSKKEKKLVKRAEKMLNNGKRGEDVWNFIDSHLPPETARLPLLLALETTQEKWEILFAWYKAGLPRS